MDSAAERLSKLCHAGQLLQPPSAARSTALEAGGTPAQPLRQAASRQHLGFELGIALKLFTDVERLHGRLTDRDFLHLAISCVH